MQEQESQPEPDIVAEMDGDIASFLLKAKSQELDEETKSQLAELEKWAKKTYAEEQELYNSGDVKTIKAYKESKKTKELKKTKGQLLQNYGVESTFQRLEKKKDSKNVMA